MLLIRLVEVIRFIYPVNGKEHISGCAFEVLGF